ncbi:4723_t:CDS:2, partial [Paraglomus occultum]
VERSNLENYQTTTFANHYPTMLTAQVKKEGQRKNGFSEPKRCRFNGYEENPKLKDDSRSELTFTHVGQKLPFTSRDEELSHLVECVRTNMNIWRASYDSKDVSSNQNIRNEEWKRGYQHLMVADGPGRGKTTLMTRGCAKVMQSHFKDNYTGRCFLWDLDVSPLDSTEIRLFRDITGQEANIAGAQTVLALRILHQSINDNSKYIGFLANLDIVLKQSLLELEDITLEAVLEHIHAPSTLSSLPGIVLLHISETNSLLDKPPYDILQLLMKAAYHFNKDQASSPSGHYMLITTFDGSYRAELLEAFNISGMQPFLIHLRPMTVQTYEQILCGLGKKAIEEGTEATTFIEKFKFYAPEQFAAALADCGDNVRLFSLMVYTVGCYNHKSRSFSWDRLFQNLLAFSNNTVHVARWMNTVHHLVLTSFPKYITRLQKLDTPCLLRVLTPALLGDPIDVNPSSKIMESDISWMDLEKDGAISLVRNGGFIRVELPFMLVQLFLGRVQDNCDSVVTFLHLLNHLHDESNWRQNEKCDIAMVVLRLLNWHFSHPARNTFTLKDILPDLHGTAANIQLKVPQAIQQLDFLGNYIRELNRHFNDDKDLKEGAYIGAGNETFADSWIVFERN